MAYQLGHTPSHAGKVTTTQPIRGQHIQDIRRLLQGRPRDLAIWSVATNCALRGGDLLDLKWSDTEDDGVRITLRLRESKTQKLRTIVLNPVASADLRAWRRLTSSEFCFSGQRGKLTVATLGRLVKSWAQEVGVTSRVSSHSLRKTWCRAMVDQHDEPLYKLMWALNHSSERQTAQYLGILQADVAGLYEHVV